MSDIKLFRVGADGAQELTGSSVAVEKSLQMLVERHMETFLGVRFLASEYATGRSHGGRIDTLGIDENNCPVIVEYKRALNENVINQGLFYLNWLMDHKGDFKVLVQERYVSGQADDIQWHAPRLLCIAGDFTKYDEQAIQQIPRAIELIRYRRYGDDLVLFQLVTATVGEAAPTRRPEPAPTGGMERIEPVVLLKLQQTSSHVRDRYERLHAFLLGLGDDVRTRTVKNYIAYRRLRNFATVEFRPKTDRILVYANVDPDSIVLEPGFTKDRRPMGDTGVWSLEITVDDDADLDRAKPLLARSYEAS